MMSTRTGVRALVMVTLCYGALEIVGLLLLLLLEDIQVPIIILIAKQKQKQRHILNIILIKKFPANRPVQTPVSQYISKLS